MKIVEEYDDILGTEELSAFLEESSSGEFPIINEKKMLTTHNLKMVGGFAIVFIIAGLQALKGYSLPYGSTIDILVSVLLFLEHAYYGKS